MYNQLFTLAAVVMLSTSCIRDRGDRPAPPVSAISDTVHEPLPVMDSINAALIGTWIRIKSGQQPQPIPGSGERLFAAPAQRIEFTSRKRCFFSGKQEMTFHATTSSILFGPGGCTGTIEQPYALNDSLLLFTVIDWNGEPYEIAYLRE